MMSTTTNTIPVPPMVEGVPDAILVAIIAVSGVLVGALIALVGHLLVSRAARKNRVWNSVWPEKAKAYSLILEWSLTDDDTKKTEVSVLAEMYASDKVRSIVNQFKNAKSYEDFRELRKTLGPAIREDLQVREKAK